MEQNIFSSKKLISFYSTGKNFFGFSSLVFSLGLTFYYLLIPTQIISEQLGRLGINTNQIYSMGLILFASGWLLNVFLFLFFSKKLTGIFSETEVYYSAIVIHHAWVFWFQIISAFGIIFLSLAQIQGSLTYDEMNIGGALANRNFLEVLQLIYKGAYRATNTQHTVSSIVAYWGMLLFGKNEWIMRLTAFPFAVLFLVTLHRFCYRFLTPLATILIYGNFLANQNITFYFHSPRGFVTMMLFSLLSLISVLDLVRDQFKSTWKNYFFFALVYLLTILTNTNGGMFALFLLATLVLWTLLNYKFFSLKQFQAAKNLILIMTAILPVFVFGAIREMYVQSELSQLNGVSREWNLGTMGYLFGLDRIWWSKIILLFCICLFIFRVRKFKIRTDFLTLFLFFSWIFILITLMAMGVRSYEARYALAFLVPFLAWIGQTIDFLPKNYRISGLALMIVLLIVIPLTSRARIYESIIGNYQSTHQFLIEARKKAIQPGACFSFEGEEYEVSAAKELYFYNVRQLDALEERSTCSILYHLYLKWGQEKKMDSIRRTVLVSDNEGRILFEELLKSP